MAGIPKWLERITPGATDAKRLKNKSPNAIKREERAIRGNPTNPKPNSNGSKPKPKNKPNRK